MSAPFSVIFSVAASRRLRAFAGPSAWLAASALLAWIGSAMFWALAGPAPASLPIAPDTDPRAAAQRIASQGPFTGQGGSAADEDARLAAPAPVFRVHGLATGFADGPGFALVSAADGVVRAVALGEEIAPGIRVTQILSDGLELQQAGGAAFLRLPGAAVHAGRHTAPAELAEIERPSNLTSLSDRSR